MDKRRKEQQLQEYQERYYGEHGIFHQLESDVASSGALKSVEGWVLFISGLSGEIQEDDIYESFSAFGQIKNLHLNLDKQTGYYKGYALIEYEDHSEAIDAIKNMNGSTLHNSKIEVDFAFKT